MPLCIPVPSCSPFLSTCKAFGTAGSLPQVQATPLSPAEMDQWPLSALALKLTSSSSGGNIGRGKRFLGGSHCQICCQGQTWKHTALNTHETQRPVFKMFPLSGWILYHKGKRKKTSAQHQQPHKNQEYPHKRKLPFLPNSAAADTVNTPVQKDNTDAAECHCLQNLQGQGHPTGINKKKIPSKGLPLQCSSCITAYKMENTAKEDLSSLFGKSQGTMHSQALGEQINSSFYVSQGTDEACG